METKYLNYGDKIVPSTTDFAIDKKLCAKTFTVLFDLERKEYFLQQINDFNINTKIYGKSVEQSELILNTFEKREVSTGVLLSGTKGSGKTLLSKLISIEGYNRHYPTIIINQSHHGELFNRFIQMIEQPCIIIFDEFEKNYKWDEQQKLLTILDGTYSSKKLFIFTINNISKLEGNLENRPSRIYYHLTYEGISKDFIIEYCIDNLKDTASIEEICKFSEMFTDFNFDMLQCLVEEMNRYGFTVKECLDIMNITPKTSSCCYYKIHLSDKNGKEYKGYDNSNYYDPFSESLNVYISNNDDNEDDSSEVAVPSRGCSNDKETISFYITDIVEFNPDRVVYKNKDGDKAIASKELTKFNKSEMISKLL